MRLPQVYLGETDSKRVARFHTFRAVERSSKHYPLPPGRVISLAGPHPMDVGCFRDLLKITPERMLYVENDRERRSGLKKVERLWPGVETYFGDVRDVLRHGKEPVSLFNADFMGILKHRDTSIFEAAGRRLVKGSVLNFTFFRGREMEGKGVFGHVLAKTSDSRGGVEERDDARFRLYKSAITRLLGGPYKVISAIKYDARDPNKWGRHSPMGVISFRNLPGHSDVVGVSDVKAIESLGRLVNCVLALIWRGLSTIHIASILNISEGSVAAFRAHNTRGTYDNR